MEDVGLGCWWLGCLQQRRLEHLSVLLEMLFQVAKEQRDGAELLGYVPICQGMCHSLEVGALHGRSLGSASHHCRKWFLPGLCLPWPFCFHPWGQELLLLWC